MAAGTIARAVIAIISCFLIPLVVAQGDSQNGSPSDEPNLRAKGLVLVKIWCLIIVFVGTFAGGISPYFYRWNESFLLLGTQFAAGVFLGTAWMHFLGDSASTFADLTDKTYPFAFMLCTAGYLITMLADLTVAWVYQKQDGSNVTVIPLQRKAESSVPTHTGETPLSLQDLQTPPQTATTVNMVTADSLVKKTSVGDSLLLVLALCFHSVFEGIAIGVAGTEADAWKALWTVCLHKIFAAIAMGIALLRIIPNRPFLSCAAYAFAFAISSPIGVAIGILIDATTEGRVADWIYAISMGFACGVFVYVAINHLILKGIIYNPQIRIPYDRPFYKYMALILGAGLIAVVMTWD